MKLTVYLERIYQMAIHTPLLGSLIKKYRLEQNMSQESLCQGICVVSYLSKIEAGLVTPSQDILEGLTQALGIHYELEEAFLKEGEVLFNDYFHALSFFLEDKVALLQEHILENYNTYLFSPLMLEALLVQANIQNETHDLKLLETLDDLEHSFKFLTSSQKALFYLFKGCALIYMKTEPTKGFNTLEQALAYERSGFMLFAVGKQHYRLGHYNLSLNYMEEAYEMCIKEGNLRCALYSALNIAGVYSSIRNMFLMEKYSKLIINLATSLGEDDSLYTAYYNLGATYLEIKDYEKALTYCERALHLRKDSPHPDVMNYHKLALIHHQLGNLEKAHDFLDRAYNCYLACSIHGTPLTKTMLDIVKITLDDPNYLHNSEYGTLLESVYNQVGEAIHFGFKQFHGNYLIDYYKANRRYKEALAITEELYVKSPYLS
ncbi:tetratricopeptide repeat protein [Niameybacter massiliensis]|uniref:tetratricopeptide repeat protein n=1 Tax=Niameybacter massiliensis TaxID=1658108 RepID=UPI0018E28D9A|nr:tetratricopeptide repeat protein [Niameybacter massiliensis]